MVDAADSKSAVGNNVRVRVSGEPPLQTIFTNRKMNDERITNLEIKFSHQEDFLQELNKVVIAQQLTIGRLEKEILDLKRSVNSENGVSPTRSMADDKPPHY